MPIFLRKILIILLTLMLNPWAEPARAESLKESWYMYRGRENMKIANYKAAIEAFENAVRLNGGNREASHQLGLAFEKQGVIDKAVNQYDSYLSKWPDDPDIALRQARLLKWSRYSYRQQDAIKYYRLALNHKNDSQVRLEYADTLAAKKETSAQAIGEYQIVLKSQPRNAAAHRGLAKAYAWTGDQDQALHHSRLAREYGDQSTDTKKLAGDIEKDRRPEVGAESLILFQSSSKEFSLSGLSAGVNGKYHLNPFLTSSVRGGGEMFWRDNTTKSGGYFGLGAEYRLAPARMLAGNLVFHSFAQDGLEGGIHYSIRNDEAQWRTGFRRDLVYDSLLSLTALEVAGRTIGAARRHLIYLERTTQSEKLEVMLRPYFGWISVVDGSPNMLIGADADIVFAIASASETATKTGWAVVGKSQMMSFQKDYSGFIYSNNAPYAGGYFSPSFFFSQEILLRYRHTLSETNSWSAEAGPSYQLVSGTSDSGAKIGGRAGASYLSELSSRMFLHVEADVRKVADVYTQARAMGWLGYKF